MCLYVYYWCGNSYFHHATDILYFWSLWLQSHYFIQHFPITRVCRMPQKMVLCKLQATGVMSIVTLKTLFFLCCHSAFWGFAFTKGSDHFRTKVELCWFAFLGDISIFWSARCFQDDDSNNISNNNTTTFASVCSETLMELNALF